MKKLLFPVLTFMSIFFAISIHAQSASKSDFYGQSFDVTKAISFDEMIKNLGDKKDMEVTVKAKVNSVCQAKGCWMNVSSESKDGEEEVFVKFKDYAFFMPLTLAGGNIIMKGKIFKEETSVEELRHYAEDAKKSEEEIAAIKDPITELKFLATGVKILK